MHPMEKNLKKKYKSWDKLLTTRRSTIENEIRIAGLGLQKSKAIKNFITNLQYVGLLTFHIAI